MTHRASASKKYNLCWKISIHGQKEYTYTMKNKNTPLGPVVAVTGSNGAMGGEVVAHLLASHLNLQLRLFIYDKEHESRPFFKSLLKKGKDRITIINGDLKNYDDVANLVNGADYVIHVGAVIPPKSDHNVQNTVDTNYTGTKNIVDAIMASKKADKIKLVHISTVALYGNRNHLHPWARMGDPVMPSAYDYYAANKARGERYVIESGIPHFVILRQSAMYHKYFLINNMADGLMFHTCWNAPLEWITDKDSGLCIQHLVELDVAGKLGPVNNCYPDKESNAAKMGFWQNAYNIGGGKDGRETGYETFNSGFALMGANARKFFRPNWNIPRNFHGVWYTDSIILENWLNYRTQTNADYWKYMRKTMWYYALGAIVPSPLIRKLAIERLLSNSNAPQHWIKLGKKARIDAFFGGLKAYEELPDTWSKFPLLAEGKAPSGPFIKDASVAENVVEIDYEDLKDESKAVRYRLDHGYDDTKLDSEIDINDLKKAAAFRGGSVVSRSMKTGDLFTRIEWKCHQGHVFSSNPFAVLKAGFWCPVCCQPYPSWDFDKVAPNIPFYSQVWYDTHEKTEVNNIYPYRDNEDEDMMNPIGKLLG